MGPAGVLARLTAIVLVLLGLGYVGGFLLPRERTIESRTVILASPERVFGLVADVKGYATWRDDVGNLQIEQDSAPLAWSETSAGWRLSFREVKRERPQTLELEFESPSGFRGRRTYEFIKTNDLGNRTNFKRTDVIEIPNPLRRVYSYLMMNVQSVIDAQTEDLGREFLGELPSIQSQPSVTPTPTAVATPTAATVPSATPSPTGAAAPLEPLPPIGLPTPTGLTLPTGTTTPSGNLPPSASPTASPVPTPR
jgi:hypothetical protein